MKLNKSMKHNIWVVATEFTKNRVVVNRWEVFYNNNIFALGWKELGDVSNCTYSMDIESIYKKCYNDNDFTKSDASFLLYNFYHNDIAINDFLIAIDDTQPFTTYNKHRIFGIGRIKSLPFYDENIGFFNGSDEILPNVMYVKWEKSNIILNTLIRNAPYLVKLEKHPEIVRILENEYRSLNNDVFLEGNSKEVTMTIYERSKEARNKCIEIYGVNCCVCGFNFEKIYGKIGENFIHVHHLEELNITKTTMTNPLTDLRPICPNCHSMLHQRTPVYSIQELQDKIRNKNQ